MDRQTINLKGLSDDRLIQLTGEIKAEQAHRIAEAERIAREGCKPLEGFVYLYCPTCGRDEMDVKNCPHKPTATGPLETDN